MSLGDGLPDREANWPRTPSPPAQSPSAQSPSAQSPSAESPAGARGRSRSPLAKKMPRALARMFDASSVPIWLIGEDGHLAYFSEAALAWLGLAADDLLGRRSVAGSPISNDPLDFLAASLSPPPGLASHGTAGLRIEPPHIAGRSIEPLEVRFLRLGTDSAYQVLAVGGRFEERKIDEDLHDAISLRQHLDGWRKRHADLATIAAAGVSSAARRLRKRLAVASAIRTHLAFFGPPGCGAESMASVVHQKSAPREPLVVVEGAVMDAELLDATLLPLVHRLADSREATATALVRGCDEMPAEAQQRLNELVDTYEPRLRLIALCGPHIKWLREPIDDPEGEDALSLLDEPIASGLLAATIERVSGLTVRVEPLAARVEDIPLLATATLDAYRAASTSATRGAVGKGAQQVTVERLSRAALDALVVYPWPGNVDELNQAIGHAVRQTHQATIAVEHLPLAIRTYRSGEKSSARHVAPVALDEALRRFELQVIDDALAAADGNRAEAARTLGISRARLIRRLADAQRGDAQRGDAQRGDAQRGDQSSLGED